MPHQNDRIIKAKAISLVFKKKESEKGKATEVDTQCSILYFILHSSKIIE